MNLGNEAALQSKQIATKVPDLRDSLSKKRPSKTNSRHDW